MVIQPITIAAGGECYASHKTPLPKGRAVKKSLVWCFVTAMAVLAGGCGETRVAPEQQAAAEKLERPVAISNSIGMKLVLIPAGEFLMGSQESVEDTARAFPDDVAEAASFQDEHPQHRVRLTTPFYLGMHEVTQEQYERVMGINNSNF